MATRRLVVCIKNAAYPVSLELRKIYEVVPDPGAERRGQIRVVDESGEDYLYDASSFVAIELPKEIEEAIVKVA